MPIDQAAYDALMAKRQQARVGSGADPAAAFAAAGNTVANIPQSAPMQPTPPPAPAPYAMPPTQQPYAYPYRPLHGAQGPHAAPLDLSSAIRAAQSTRDGLGAGNGIPDGAPLAPLKHAIVASASSGDAYDRMLMKTIADARTSAIGALSQRQHPYAFVPVNDYKRGHIHVVNANGHDVVLDMNNPQDQREYERMFSHIGMPGHEVQSWADQASKGLYQFLDPNQQEVKTDAGQRYDYGSWHPVAPTAAQPPPQPMLTAAQTHKWTDATPQKLQLDHMLGRQ